MDEGRLDLYELDHREPIGHVDYRGRLHLPERHPQVLFADVPVHLHLSDRLTVSPFDSSSDQTGPGPHGIETAPSEDDWEREAEEAEREEVEAELEAEQTAAQ